eukprot:symbB.v1.2.005263.t1/scaffold286.1/size306100/2
MARDAAPDYVGSVLKDMYGSSMPNAAARLMRDHAKAQQAKARVQPRWTSGHGHAGHAAPPLVKHVDLKIPRVGRQHLGASSIEQPPRLTRRPFASIRVMTNDYQRQDDPIDPGRDGTLEKRRLQDRHAYGFGNALPTSKAPPGHWMPEEAIVKPQVKMDHARGKSQQETLATDIVTSVKERQEELATVEESLKKMERGPVWRHREAAKITSLQKRKVELRNGIARDVKDLETFIDCTKE